MGWRTTSYRKCRPCGQRIVRHQVGNGVLIWVHNETGLIWCWPGQADLIESTASPSWNLPRKWSNA